jgi:hypothetical protein
MDCRIGRGTCYIAPSISSAEAMTWLTELELLIQPNRWTPVE